MIAFVKIHPIQQRLDVIQYEHNLKGINKHAHSLEKNQDSIEDSSILQHKFWSLTTVVVCTILHTQSSKELLV